MYKTQKTKLICNISIEIIVLLLIIILANVIKCDKTFKMFLLFLNFVYLWIINVNIASAGDTYIKNNYRELYNKYYNNDYINRPQFIVGILLFSNEIKGEDIDELKKEAKIVLLFSLFVVIASVIIAIR